MKEMSAEWASAQQALDSKSYGDYMIENPYKSDSTFRQDVVANFRNEVLSLASFAAAIVPGGLPVSIALSSGDTGLKFSQGNYGGATVSATAAIASSGELYLSRGAPATLSWSGVAQIGLRRAGYVGAAYTAYSVAWDPYVSEMARQQQPDKIVNPKVTGLHGTITGARQAIEFYSGEYNKLGCAEFYQ
jgi:hypothetical protein